MRPIGPILELLSPAKRVRAELAVETVWIGTTVYPECPVWRVWYGERLVVDTSTVGLAPATGPLAYGMRFVKATRHRPQTGIGPGRSLVARFAARDGRELEVTLRVTDLSAFCAAREPRKRKQDGTALSNTCFPQGSVLLGDGVQSPARDHAQGCAWHIGGEWHSHPWACGGVHALYSPSSKVIAFWRHGLEQHVVFFDRPGDLAVRRFGALEHVSELAVADGKQGCNHLFLTVPFTKAALPAPVFGEALTPAFRAAFELILERGPSAAAGRLAPPKGVEGAAQSRACTTDPAKGVADYWMMRGEPGEYAVAARRQGGVWQVAGVTADERTLTVRFEDVWLRMPAELRAERYTVEILRDPIKGEAGDAVEESFPDQAPDVRVALDLAKNGGFVLTFRPQEAEGA